MTDQERIRIAVVGVGAIGGAIAADLADLERHDITLCARTSFETLVVEHPSGRSIANARVTTDPAGLERAAWVLLATKAYQCADAAPWLAALCDSSTTVAVLQNGVDHVERVSPLLPPGANILPVVIHIPAERNAPGHVSQAHTGMLIVPDDETGRDFAWLFDGARTQVRPTADFVSQAWWKLLSNASLGGICALALRSNQVVEDPEIRALCLTLMRETAEVGRAEGAQLPDDAPEKTLQMVLGEAGGHWSSIAVDRREGRPMEWALRNAVVGVRGRRHGIATPMNDAITALLRVADQSR